jgi:FMN reductase [NAD(P)H]
MEFSEVVRRRRMVRNYDPDKPVERESLERIAAAAQRAPSAGFSQGQRLVIVTEPARRQRIADICHEPDYVAAGFDPWVSRAPALIIPTVSEQIYHARYQEPDKIDDDGHGHRRDGAAGPPRGDRRRTRRGLPGYR